MTTPIPLMHCDSGYINKSQFPYQPSGTSNNPHSMRFFPMLVHLAEMKVIKWFSTAFCTPRPGIGLHRTYEKRKHISMTLTISRGVALLFLKNKQYIYLAKFFKIAKPYTVGIHERSFCLTSFVLLHSFLLERALPVFGISFGFCLYVYCIFCVSLLLHK